MADGEPLSVATAQVTLEPQVVFPMLVDLDAAPARSSIEIARLAVPDGALHEGTASRRRWPSASGKSDVHCRVSTLERPVAVRYEVFHGDVLMLRLTQHLTPMARGSELRWSCEAVDERLDQVLVRHHLDLSLQRFLAVLEPKAGG